MTEPAACPHVYSAAVCLVTLTWSVINQAGREAHQSQAVGGVAAHTQYTRKEGPEVAEALLLHIGYESPVGFRKSSAAACKLPLAE